jgi:hypothetical protein
MTPETEKNPFVPEINIFNTKIPLPSKEKASSDKPKKDKKAPLGSKMDLPENIQKMANDILEVDGLVWAYNEDEEEWNCNHSRLEGEVLMKLKQSLQAGDIILSDRLIYQHYGVYAGNDRVIHYASENGDFGFDVKVRETSLAQFAQGGDCKIVMFTENRDGSKHFSPKETVRRARSRIGEESYNLLFNNCEHFVLWCKCGKSKSIQVEKAVTAAIVIGTVAIAASIAKSNEEG